ncbi:putative nucleic acid-binding protein [Paucibacter oligotrophus]|uniref:Putative nucleic acid-binding protein n=1 Tax=Roseateles oligotrophus TaxID=1769250 RepID=A0A840LBP3_9BURK|nr:hypothetical protein [Roseateles oligotrophus]MBB4844072.1 putative nucleic acid-binding protein [Roseateles oligotrophus]
MRIALLDAGPLIALFDPREPAHDHYYGMVFDPELDLRLYTTWPCVVEASHLLAGRHRLAMLDWVAQGAVQVYPFDQAHLQDMLPWMQRYSELHKREMNLADASLYWLAQESGVTAVLTLDVADFTRYRLPDGRAFEIL